MDSDAPPTAEGEAAMRLYWAADAATDCYAGSMENLTELMIGLREAARHYARVVQAAQRAETRPRGKRERNA
jgi:hypothetical protein